MIKFRLIVSSRKRELKKVRFIRIIVKVSWRYCIIENLKYLCANFQIESNAQYLRRSDTVAVKIPETFPR